MPAPTPIPVTQTRSMFRSTICPHDCNSCAWGIGGNAAKPGSDVRPLVDKTLLSYSSECGQVDVVLTGAKQVGALHRGKYFAATGGQALDRLLVSTGLMPLT